MSTRYQSPLARDLFQSKATQHSKVLVGEQMQMDPRPTYENGVGLPPRHTSVPTHTQWLSPRRRNANSLQNAIRLLEEYTKENDLLREEYA